MRSIVVVVVVMLVLAFSIQGATVQMETSRANTIAYLDQIPNGVKNAQFKAWINDGNQSQFTLGEEIKFNFNAASDVFVSIAYVDTHGILSLLEPQFGHRTNKLNKGITMTFPAPNSGISIQIEPPLGKERIYFVATEHPIRQEVFITEANTGSDKATLFQATDSTGLARGFLSALLETNSSTSIAVVFVDHEVIQRPGIAQYTKQDIVGYFSQRSARSIANPKLDADIRFESNSAILSQEARINLDVWGESLLHPYLSNFHFQIGGHTDDIGNEIYNLELSERRAKSVSEYLISKFGINERRLIIQAYGESSPKVEGTNKQARTANRRVEFQQISD